MHIERAIEIALEAHRGAVDKAGAPYILHPLRLVSRATDDDVRVVAALHDVVEDTDWTIDRLRAEGLTDAQAAGLDAVTRRHGESYEDFVIRAGQDPVGRAVKILDLQDNADRSRIPAPTGKDEARFEKYRAALAVLES